MNENFLLFNCIIVCILLNKYFKIFFRLNNDPENF